MNLKKTVNLPRTEFPMRGKLPQQEPGWIDHWTHHDIYGQMKEQGSGRPRFILHDGPPYANGKIHLGTALNKVLKDIVVKYKHLAGFDTPYVPGWDCHGLPIELKTLEEYKGLADTLEIRRHCAEYAMRFVDEQRRDFVRLGVLGEWNDPYLTLAPRYEAVQVEVLARLVERGLVHRALKPIYWCASCKTALAEAEIEYEDHESPSIFVRFRALPETLPPALRSCASDSCPVYLCIWTTTPWTLPGNMAIAVAPSATYAAVPAEDGCYVVAEPLIESVASKTRLPAAEPRARFGGADLVGTRCHHPFLDRESVVIPADHVTMEATGLVHTAPGHGHEDFYAGKAHGLEPICPVDERGVLTGEAGPFAGHFFEKANPIIVSHLEGSRDLLGSETITHSYAHCWRCKNPVIYRACPQWFIGIDEDDREDRRTLRVKAQEQVKNVRWFPPAGINRIGGMLENRPDWCISRQRVWGVPIPALHCDDCGGELLDPDYIRKVGAVFREEGSNAWLDAGKMDPLQEGLACPSCKGTRLSRETDILDVWFDSGVSHAAVLTAWDGLSWPADLYLEGSDQHRGWFQTSLLTSVGWKGEAPYREVVTHGFVVDEDGRKMSKSLGNVTAPQDIVNRFGADILRMWVCSADYTVDIKVSESILKQVTDCYRRLRNTLRFLLGNLKDFDRRHHAVARADMAEMDRWALDFLARLAGEVKGHYEAYRFDRALNALHNACAVELSSFYLDVLKDRLYCSAPAARERRSAQTALDHILRALVRMLAPILSFTSEEVWSHLREEGEDEASVFLLDWPEIPEEWRDDDLSARWKGLLALRQDAMKVLEQARAEKVIGSSLEACLCLHVEDRDRGTELRDETPLLEEIFIVSQLDLADSVPEGSLAGEACPGTWWAVRRARGSKCERCWRYDEGVGQSEVHREVCPRCAVALASGAWDEEEE